MGTEKILEIYSFVIWASEMMQIDIGWQWNGSGDDDGDGYGKNVVTALTMVRQPLLGRFEICLLLKWTSLLIEMASRMA